MKRFVIVDEFLHDHCVVEADDHRSAALKIFGHQLKDCLGPELLEANLLNPGLASLGAVSFMDEASKLGWGKGCKFEGQSPNHQVLLTVFEVAPLS